MITVEEFRSAIRSNNLETVLDDILLGDAAAHVTATNIDICGTRWAPNLVSPRA